MNIHVTRLLYEYVEGKLGEKERKAVEEHLLCCGTCAEDLRIIRASRSLIRGNDVPPSSTRDDAFWTAFLNEVDSRIASGQARPEPVGNRIKISLSVYLATNRKVLLAGCGMLAAAAIAVAVLLPGPQESSTVSSSNEGFQSTVVPGPTAHLMNDYLRRSKILLVGLSNHGEGRGKAGMDLALERGRSRQLVNVARYLKRQPLDIRSAKLIDDLERIQIELANLDTRRASSDVEPIIAGIRQENLLFKIRMTEMLMTARVNERGSQ
jgi:hypothetical protein